MDSLQEVIQSLDDVQQQEFIYFIQRKKYRKGRKDLLLFNLLKKNKTWSSTELVSHLKTSNKNAYHTIRKRLFNHLADFFVLKSTSDDASGYSHVNGLLAVVNYLFDKSLSKFGWKYLLLAEQLSFEHNYHDILNSIYLLQIDKAHLNKEINLNETINKYHENQLTLRQNEKLKIASSVIREKLSKQKLLGFQIDFQRIVNETIDNLGLNINLLKTPKIVLEFIKIIRSGIVVNKDFNEFEPFVISNYNRLYKHLDGEVNPIVHAEFVYILAHTSYRNKKFKQSQKYLAELGFILDSCPRSYSRSVSSKVVHLRAVNNVFLDNVSVAINSLTSLLTSKLSIEDRSNTIVNLGVYCFLSKDFKQSQKLLNELTHSENWYKKTMGIEWVIKKNLMEILLFIDLGNNDLAEARIKSLEYSFSSLKNIEIYSKAFNYLKLIKQYLMNPMLDKNILKQQIDKTINFVSYEKEDIHAMSFYAWIKSKMTDQDFYQTLLELVK